MRLSLLLLLALVLSAPAGCAKAPPALSPQATVAFYNTRVIKGLDLLRDTAVEASAQTPPVIAFGDRQKVVAYHQSALKIIRASGSGWKPTVLAGLDELLKDLPPPTSKLLSPYVSLIKTVLSEVA